MSDTDLPALGRREARKIERRAAIVAVAERHFLDHGYDRTSMSAIAEQMGGSKGTLWSYFSSKEELFAAVIDKASAVFRLEVLGVLDTGGELVDVLTSMSERYILRLGSADGIALQRLIIGEVERSPKIGRIFYDRAAGVSRAHLSRFVAGRMLAGVLRQDDPDEAAEMLLGLCGGGYHQRVLWGVQTPDAGLAKREAALAVSQFLRCYRPTGEGANEHCD